MMQQIIIAVVSAALGGIATYVGQVIVERAKKPRKKIRCDAVYCGELLTSQATNLGEDVELRVGGQVLRYPVVVNYTLTSAGNETIKECKIQVISDRADRIIRAQILLPNELHCERIKPERSDPNRIRFTWSHANPGDALTLVLLVSPCSSAECVRLEVDAEGLEVDKRPMRADCSARLPDDLFSSEIGLELGDVAEDRS